MFVAEIKPFILQAIEKVLGKQPELRQLPKDIFGHLKNK